MRVIVKFTLRLNYWSRLWRARGQPHSWNYTICLSTPVLAAESMVAILRCHDRLQNLPTAHVLSFAYSSGRESLSETTNPKNRTPLKNATFHPKSSRWPTGRSQIPNPASLIGHGGHCLICLDGYPRWISTRSLLLPFITLQRLNLFLNALFCIVPSMFSLSLTHTHSHTHTHTHTHTLSHSLTLSHYTRTQHERTHT
jgi:hypothetical protein